MADREVRVSLVVAGTAQFQQSMQQASQSASQFGQGSQQAAGQSQRAFAGMAKGIGGAIAGIGFGAFVTDAISAASDLNETLNKTSVIFGDSAKDIEAWADGAAKNLGLSKGAALDAASGFGDMFAQLGFTSGQAADMSKSTVQLAADLGSFNNLGTDEVLDKISGALRGEYDSLQALIPNINGARVETEALAATGKTSVAALTAQEKATATLAIVTKDSARAQGDFKNTSDGLANSQKIAAAQFEDTKAKIGQSLLPVMQQLVQLISTVAIPVVGALGEVFKVIGPILSGIVSGASGLIGFFTSLPGPVKAVVTALGAIAALKLLGVFAGIQKGVASLAATITQGGLAGKVKGLGASLASAFGGAGGLGLAAGIGAVTFLFSKFREEQEVGRVTAEKYKQQVSDLAGALAESGGAIDENVRKQVLANVEANGGVEKAKAYGVSLRDLVDAQLGNADALARVSAGQKTYAAATEASGDANKYTSSINALYGAEIAKTGSALAEAQALEAQRADALKASGDAAAAATAQTYASSEAIEADNNARRGAAFSADAYSAAVAAAGAATRDTGDAQAAAAEHAAGLASQQDILNLSYESAKSAADNAAEALSPFEQASKDASVAQSELASQADRVTDALDRQAGRIPSLEEANARAAATGDDLADSFKLGTKEAESLGAAILNTDGTVKTADAGGRTFRQGILDTRQAMVDQATAAYAQAVATGNVAGASDAATKAQQGTYDQFITTATAILGSKEAAEKAAAAYGLIPSQVSSTISADDQASSKIYDAKRAAEEFAQKQYNASVGLDTSALDRQIAEANAKLAGLGRVTANRSGPNAARATGGAIYGPGTGTSDSIPALLSNGEHVLTAAEVAAAGGQGAIYRFRQALLKGNAPRFASGGSVNGRSFAGLADRQVGDRESIIAGAFRDLLDSVKDLQGAAADMAKAQQEATQNLKDAKAKQSETAVKGRESVSAARASAAEKLAAAEKKLDEVQGKTTKTAAERAAKATAVAKAEDAVAAARKRGEAAVAKAITAQDKANAASAKRVSSEARELQLANAASKSAAERARVATSVFNMERELRSKQSALARKYDDYAARVEKTEAKLQDLRDKAAGYIADGRSTALGSRGGLLGSDAFQGTNITATDVRKQLSSALSGARGFDSTFARAQKLGVSGSILEALSKDPDGRGGQVLKALAGGTRADANAANTLYAQLGKTGAVTGNRLSQALGINAQIASTSGTLASQRGELSLTGRQIESLGAAMAKASLASFKGQTFELKVGADGFTTIAQTEIRKSARASAARRQAKGKR